MDLIDRQQAIGKIKDWMKFIGYSHGERNVMECTIQMLEELPSAQPLNDDWEKYSDLEFSEPYYTDIQVLSQLRSMYNCFDPKEEPIYHALSMAIEALEENESLAKSLNDAAELIRKLQKNEWIPCSERLPEKDGKYLITEVDGYVTCDYFRLENGDWRTTFWRYPKAWMPLPEPWKEE